jgi:signal transduction histidine kinase
MTVEILLAEDEWISSQMIQKILADSGFSVVAADSGTTAWELFAQRPFQVVITDWMMPGMDGISLCRKIRAAQQPGYVYIIMLTAKESKADVISGFDAGADDYIAKPVEPEELKARLRVGQRILQLEEAQKKAGIRLLQSEKMASVGQLAAGVAHEINNPTGFVSSNLKTLADYLKDLIRLITEYRGLVAMLSGVDAPDLAPEPLRRCLESIHGLEAEVDLDFILGDIPALIEESREGTERIKKIVMDLKDFAHPGNDKACEVDVNHGIESTLNVVWNEIKYKATVVKDLGDLPKIQGFPQQLNQVFMNILVNAGQAITEKGEVRIATRAVNHHVEVEISDSGVGIPKENLQKIFDPFFTTKDVGKGTGLGLHMAHNIVKRHQGHIDVTSEPGRGTVFTIRLPVDQA